MTDTINSAIAAIASGSDGLLQFYVLRHSDYELVLEKAREGDGQMAAVASLMTMIAKGMIPSGQTLPCFFCDDNTGFAESGGVALVGASPFQPGSRCMFRLMCRHCCTPPDAALMLAVVDRWKALITPTLRVLPEMIHEAGHA